MFYSLLLSSLVTSIILSLIVVSLFKKSVESMLSKVIEVDIYSEWSKYISFVMYVVGITSGIKISELQKFTENTSFLNPDYFNFEKVALNVFLSAKETAQSLAWLLFVFYMVVLISLVIIKIFSKKS